VLAIVTYKSFASPIRKLEFAAKNSIDHNKPFTLRESGPYEIRSVTKRLQGLIIGLESTVNRRTSALRKSNAQLTLEIQQRKELETQLVHAQKMEAVGQLASGIAHEINSPSQFANDNILFLKDATDGFIKKLNQDPDAPDDREIEFFKENAPEAVDQAAEGISRITTIVKSMKNFAYRDAESEKRNNDLNQAIRSTVVVATNEWKYHAELDLHLQEDLPLVPCNIGEINQVVLNLIVNGAHAIRDRIVDGQKGNIVVSTKHYPDAQCVVIAIADNGGGIPAKVQARIFEPFFTTKEVGVGTGQGLAIAHNVIVKSHQGQIWFDSKEGIGTTFYIKLPMIKQNAQT
jgi:two-component system NtrC family sensor kinase